jgi:hypothetical protein
VSVISLVKSLSSSRLGNDLSNHALLLGDLAGVQAKVARWRGRWRKRWEHFLASAAAECRNVLWYGSTSGDVPLHGALAFRVTEDARWGEIARRDLLHLRDCYEETLEVGHQDLDTWIYAAAMARRAIALDWVWDTGILNDSERDGFAELFVSDSLKYPYVVLHHRVPPHANNQGLAMALNLMTVGYLFGVKRDRDPRARHMLEVGLQHVIQQVAFLPPGGYSGEGSTYMVGVADPLLAIACAVIEEITGEDFFNRELEPSGNCARRILELNTFLPGPSELLPGWDQHGFHLRRTGTTAAYMAWRTGESRYASHILHGDTWELSGHFAWLADDHVWQVLWLPEHSDRAPASPPPRVWAEPRVAGAIYDVPRKCRLFQTWDISGPRPVRQHMNPNAIHLEAWDSVLTVDGNAVNGFPLDADPRMQYVHLYGKRPATLSWAGGSLGAHSCIMVDNRPEITPRSSGFENRPRDTVTGHLLRIEDTTGRAVLSVDAAEFYQAAFPDLRSVVRNSAWIDAAEAWVVVDQIEAGCQHDYMWQLVLRHGATRVPHGLRLRTPEHVVLDILAGDDAGPFQLVDVPGYPSTLECKCHHARRALHGACAEWVTVMVPRLGREQIADWSDGWLGRRDPEDAGLKACWQRRGVPDAAPAAWADLFFSAAVFSPDLIDTTVAWMIRRCSYDAGADDTLFLELPRAYEFMLWIDGEPIDVPSPLGFHHPEPRMQAPYVDVTRQLAGKREVTLVVRHSRQGKIGPTGGVRLHRRLDVPAPSCTRKGDFLEVATHGRPSTAIDLASLRTQAFPPDWPESQGERIADALNTARAHLPPPDSRGAIPSEPSELAGWSLLHPEEAPVGALILGCHHPDWFVRMASARALGAARSRAAVPRLLTLIEEEKARLLADAHYPAKYRVLEMAVLALDQIGDSSAADAIAALLAPESFYGVRRLAADALGRIGQARHASALQAWTQDPDMETAAAARRSLGALRRG